MRNKLYGVNIAILDDDSWNTRNQRQIALSFTGSITTGRGFIYGGGYHVTESMYDELFEFRFENGDLIESTQIK